VTVECQCPIGRTYADLLTPVSIAGVEKATDKDRRGAEVTETASREGTDKDAGGGRGKLGLINLQPSHLPRKTSYKRARALLYLAVNANETLLDSTDPVPAIFQGCPRGSQCRTARGRTRCN